MVTSLSGEDHIKIACITVMLVQREFGLNVLDGIPDWQHFNYCQNNYPSKFEQAKAMIFDYKTKLNASRRNCSEMERCGLNLSDDARKAVEDLSNVCYLLYNKQGEVLYVGKANKFLVRWKHHVKTKKVWEVSQVELRAFKTEQEALVYENLTIYQLRPTWNRMYNSTPCYAQLPEVQQTVVLPVEFKKGSIYIPCEDIQLLM